MSLWVIGAIGAVIFLVSVVPGMLMWWPTRGAEGSRADFGVNLVTGALVALAIFVLQILFEQRLDRIDHKRQVQADRQNLEITIGLQKDLTGIKLDHKPLDGFYFYGRKLREAKLASSDLTSANLTRADLSCADLSEAILKDADAANAVLEGTDLHRAHLESAVLSGSHRSVRGCDDGQQHHPNFAGAWFDNAVLDHVRLVETGFAGAHFKGAALDGAILTGSDFRGAHLVDTGLERAQLNGATLIGAELIGANLSEANLRGAELQNAALTGAQLYGADLRRAKLRDADLSGATYDSRTRWPAHFKQRRCPASRTQGCRVP